MQPPKGSLETLSFVYLFVFPKLLSQEYIPQICYPSSRILSDSCKKKKTIIYWSLILCQVYHCGLGEQYFILFFYFILFYLLSPIILWSRYYFFQSQIIKQSINFCFLYPQDYWMLSVIFIFVHLIVEKSLS